MLDYDSDKNRTEILSELSHLTGLLERHIQQNQIGSYKPYKKQRDFHIDGKWATERLLMAANQVGKTYSAGMESAMHLTGKYPDWWKGKRWKGPVRAWASGVTSESTRDNPQRILLGVRREFGTGAIPASAIIDVQMARGVPDAVDSVTVKHQSGGYSYLWFKSYERGREKWQGQTLDFIWYDEEPPIDIYTEGLTRVNATKGITFITFTPLLGMSEVVRRFIQPDDPDFSRKFRSTTSMTLSDAPHYTEDMREQILSQYPDYERDARTKGIPMLGSGRVVPVAEEAIKFSLSDFPTGIPDYWPRIAAIDFAEWETPLAVVWAAWDRDADVLYLYDEYYVSRKPMPVHAQAITARGSWIPMSWPHDGLRTIEGGSQHGILLKDQWRKQGVRMLPERAQYEDGNYSVEAGVQDLLLRMQTARFKISDHLGDWWDQFRMYHRKNGKIVKERDHLMDATRYLIMSLSKSRVKGSENRKLFTRTMNDSSPLPSFTT